MKREISANLNQGTDTTTLVGTTQEVNDENLLNGRFGAGVWPKFINDRVNRN